MVELRWRQRAGPGLIAIGVLGAVLAGPAGAREVTWSPPDCAPGQGTLATAVGAARLRPVDPVTASWYRLDPRFDRAAEMVGHRLVLAAPGGAPPRVVDLPAESFASGPVGGLVLVGADDGRSSTLRLVDTLAGCAWPIGAERDVVRRAVIDPTGSAIHEFRVDRRTRADLGVWRRSLDGSGNPTPVLEPIPVDPRFGRTFSTELGWSLDGGRLVVQTCGAIACRTRVVDVASGAVVSIDDPDLGEAVGVSGDRLLVYAACGGLPCPLYSVDLESGERTELDPEAGLATIVVTDAGDRVVHEATMAGEPALRIVDPAGREDGRIAPEPGFRPVPGPARAQAGVEAPRGWLALAPDGRPSATGDVVLEEVRE